MEREFFEVLENEMEDFTKSSGSWHINGEEYIFIDTFLNSYSDGEGHSVIVQRQTDKKYFQFDWSYYHNNYYYEPQWEEVKPKIVTTTIWKWDEN